MKKVLIILSIFVINKSLSQDLVFGNFFNSVIYSNAAFTGASFDTIAQNSGRMQTSYRNQRIGPSQNVFQSNFLSYDQKIPKSNGNVGAYFISDRLGNNGMFNSSQFNLNYSYFTPFNKKGLVGRYGLSVGLKNQGIDLGKLRFEDQIDYRIGVVRNSNEIIAVNNMTRVDVNAGILFHNNKSFLGFSMQNITRPNFDYIGRTENYIDRRYTIQIGRLFQFRKRNSSILPTVSILKQREFTQSNFSISLNVNSFSIGSGMRSTMDKIYRNSGSLFFVGLKSGKYKFQYLYESNFISTKFFRAPTHEISILFDFTTHTSNKKQNTFFMSY
jgi:type IX secretion system PorP/SprF family membrane protein